jgi:leucyl aminopeptidase (aminopeptidase T)
MPSGEAGPGDARLATLVLQRSLRLQRGENVVIEAWPHNIDLAEEFVLQARRLGIRPMIIYEGERALFESQRIARPADASAISAPELAALAAADAFVCLPGPADPVRWSELPAPRRQAADRWLATWNRLLRDRSVRACYFHPASATEVAARDFGVKVDEWRQEARDASDIDPTVFRRSGRRLVQRLRAGRTVTISHPNGTDLELGLAGLSPFLEDGCVDADDLLGGHYWTGVPGGYVIVPVNARVAEGRFLANRPSRHRRGLNDGIDWTFSGGRLRRYEARDPSGNFLASYRAAGRERERPALLSIGLNPRIHESPLLEDQARGMTCLYIGYNQDFGGHTRGSYRDYALVGGADVAIDGKPVVRAGELV